MFEALIVSVLPFVCIKHGLCPAILVSLIAEMSLVRDAALATTSVVLVEVPRVLRNASYS